MLIYRIRVWMGYAQMGLDLYWYKTLANSISKGLLEPLSTKYGFEIATSLDYLERWSKQNEGEDGANKFDLGNLEQILNESAEHLPKKPM